ncbi:hypothetical protein [Mycoplasmopsis cynos]|nr:hypothetical protein [Mycoplasmopsis cynos]UWV81349.1 hypothetical protein NW065_05365 [Mycoplasmopsis cynos]UWV93771.1 hypothetical protein NW062_00170 [Mycoplasmopsis cynos]
MIFIYPEIVPNDFCFSLAYHSPIIPVTPAVPPIICIIAKIHASKYP